MRAGTGRKFGAVLQSDLGDSRAALNWGKALCLRAELASRAELLPEGEAPDPQVRANVRGRHCASFRSVISIVSMCSNCEGDAADPQVSLYPSGIRASSLISEP